MYSLNIWAWLMCWGGTPRVFHEVCAKKRLCCRALVHAPRVLLLDEPTAGLDETSARTVRELVRQLGQDGGTVIYSTHQLAEAERVCNRIVIIHNGQVRADGTPQELLEQTQTRHLEEAYVRSPPISRVHVKRR